MNGRSGSRATPEGQRFLLREDSPAADGRRSATPTVDAWARWAVPKASMHEDVGQGSEPFGELGLVLLLPRFEPGVLEDNDRTGRSISDQRFDLGPVHATGLNDREPPELTESLTDRCHAERRVNPLRTAEVARNDHLSPALPQGFDRGEAGPNPEVIGDRALVQRNVEIRPNEDTFACDVEMIERREGHVSPVCARVQRGGTSSPSRCRTTRTP